MSQAISVWDKITAAAENRILMLDGAMGTMLQKQNLQEDDFRGERFKDWPSPLQGNNDLLVLTKPSVVEKVHNAFLEAGADLKPILLMPQPSAKPIMICLTSRMRLRELRLSSRVNVLMSGRLKRLTNRGPF